jgi:hypothetical protein
MLRVVDGKTAVRMTTRLTMAQRRFDGLTAGKRRPCETDARRGRLVAEDSPSQVRRRC